MTIETISLDTGGTMTAYLPALPDRPGPAVLVLPGGGCNLCAPTEGEPVALAYLAQGFAAFVLDYAVGEDHTFADALADGRAAVAWLRGHGDTLGVRGDQITAVGFSAGGHLAAALGTMVPDPVNAVVLGYPVILSEFGAGIQKELPSLDEEVTDQSAPAFVFACQGDPAVPVRHTLRYLDALARHGVPFEAHLYRTGTHAMSLATRVTAGGDPEKVNGQVAEWFPLSVRFLEELFHLNEPEAPAAESKTAEPVPAEATVPGTQQPLRDLLAIPAAAAALTRFLPEGTVEQIQGNPMVLGFSLRKLSGFKPELIPPEKLDMLDAALNFLMKRNLTQADASVEQLQTEQPSGDLPVAVCLGDSITYGSGVEAQRKQLAWPYLLGQALQGQCQVLNCGMPGATLQREGDLPYGTDRMKAARDTGPETVLVCFGTNDSKAQNWNADRFLAQLQTLVEEVKGWPTVRRVILLAPPRAFPQADTGVAAAGIREEVLQGSVRPMLRDCARGLGTEFLDLYALTSGHPEYFDDGVHPNALGNRRIAEAVYHLLAVPAADKE